MVILISTSITEYSNHGQITNRQKGSLYTALFIFISLPHIFSMIRLKVATFFRVYCANNKNFIKNLGVEMEVLWNFFIPSPVRWMQTFVKL